VARPGLARAAKKAGREGRPMVGGDEAGGSLRPGMARTDAPCGQSPGLRGSYSRHPWAVRRGSTRDGCLDTRGRDEAVDSLARVSVLRHGLPHVSGTWRGSWDGAPMPQGSGRAYGADGGAKPMQVEPRPPYAPELNPGEGGGPRADRGPAPSGVPHPRAPLE
jgi:hypothetical protein